jgi:hypothetical protein
MLSTESSDSKLSVDALGKLEALDDVIFPAIDGDLTALASAEQAWKTTIDEVGVTAIAETRCEYLRYAQSTWQMLKGRAISDPLRLFAVLKVIGLLVGEDV